MRREVVRSLWWVGAGIVALFAVNTLMSGEAAGLAEDSVSALAVAALWVGLYRRGPHRRPWVWIGLGVALWVAGDLVWDGYALAGLVRPDVSLADLFYLAGYPLL